MHSQQLLLLEQTISDGSLRTAGPEVYDQWVSHEIPFSDPRIKEAVDRFGEKFVAFRTELEVISEH